MTALDRLGLMLGRLGFGAAPIGNLYHPVSDEQAHGTVEAAWASGVRYFDTAPLYGLGLAELRLGAALSNRPRDEFVVSTKVGRILDAPAGSRSGAATGFDLDYSRDGVRRSIEDSLTRLGLDRVDIVYVHDPDEHIDQTVAESIPALAELRDEGVLRAIGVGLNFTAPLLRLIRQAPVDIVMMAGRWTLVDRSGLPVLEECGNRGIAVAAAAPFNSGLLAYPWPPDDAHFDYQLAAPEVLARARVLAAACDRAGVPLPQAALQFPLRHPAVACVVAGMASAAEVRRNTDWMQTPVAEDLWSILDSIRD